MKAAAKMDVLLKDVQISKFGLMKFNFIMARVIPFNLPHKIKLRSLADTNIVTELPYIRKNLNHLKGIHACAIATLAEYTSGIFLLSKASSGKYRLIMKTLRVEYSYQGKTTLTAKFSMTDAEFKEKVMVPLDEVGVFLGTFSIEVRDTAENLVATAYVDWQIKDWQKTRTKVS